MKEQSELKKEFQKIMKQHYFLKSDSELPYDNILSCMEDAYNLNRQTPVVQVKTAEEILHQTFEKHNNDPNSKLGIIEIEVEAMEAYHAQFTPSAKSVEVEEAAEASRKQVQKNGEGYDFWVKNGMSTVKNGDTNIAFKHGFEKGSNWQQQKQAETISRLTESLKTIYSLAKPGSAIYDICDTTLNQKQTDKA